MKRWKEKLDSIKSNDERWEEYIQRRKKRSFLSIWLSRYRFHKVTFSIGFIPYYECTVGGERRKDWLWLPSFLAKLKYSAEWRWHTLCFMVDLYSFAFLMTFIGLIMGICECFPQHGRVWLPSLDILRGPWQLLSNVKSWQVSTLISSWHAHEQLERHGSRLARR